MRTSTTQIPLGTQLNQSHPLSRGLIGCWPMNEGGGQLSRDIINSNDGTLTNGAVYKQAARGNTILFDGVNDYSNLSKNNLAPGSGGWSWNAIARSIATTNNTQYIYFDGIDNPSNNPAVAIGIISTPTFFTLIRDASSNSVTLSSVAMSYNVWYNLCITYNQGTKTLTQYINGVSVGTNTNAAVGNLDTNSASLPVMGAGKPSGVLGNYWNGNLNNVFVYSRCLLPNEVRQLYSNPYQMYINKK